MAAETRFLVFDNSMTLRWDQCENVGLPHSHWKIVWEPVDSFIARPVTQTGRHRVRCHDIFPTSSCCAMTALGTMTLCHDSARQKCSKAPRKGCSQTEFFVMAKCLSQFWCLKIKHLTMTP